MQFKRHYTEHLTHVQQFNDSRESFDDQFLKLNFFFFKQTGVVNVIGYLFNYACHIPTHMFLCKSATEEAGMNIHVCDDPLLGRE